MAKTTWLQVTGQSPRPFKTKKAATEAFTLELERFTAEGWLKAWGTLASGVMVLERAKGKFSGNFGDGTWSADPRSNHPDEPALVALVVSTVDADGYDTDPLFTWRKMQEDPLSRASCESG